MILRINNFYKILALILNEQEYLKLTPVQIKVFAKYLEYNYLYKDSGCTNEDINIIIGNKKKEMYRSMKLQPQVMYNAISLLRLKGVLRKEVITDRFLILDKTKILNICL